MAKNLRLFFLLMVIGWAVCGAIMGLGPKLLPMPTVLIIHAAAAPFVFGTLSWFYYRKYAAPKPLLGGLLFLGFVATVDFFLVGLIIEKSLDMFKSLLGIWIPFALIFLSVAGVGSFVRSRKSSGEKT